MLLVVWGRELEAREGTWRPNDRPRRFRDDIVRQFAMYDVEVDTGVLDPDAAAEAVVSALRTPR